MKRILFILIAALTLFTTCKKDEEENGDLNTLKFMDGQFAGTTFKFDPNVAYWAEVNQITRSIRLQFGETVSPPANGIGTGDMFFYYSEGKKNIHFPSPEGQYMRFRLMIGSQDYTFQQDDVNMIVTEFNDDFIEGTISGDMCWNCASDSVSTIYMEFKVNTQKN